MSAKAKATGPLAGHGGIVSMNRQRRETSACLREHQQSVGSIADALAPVQ